MIIKNKGTRIFVYIFGNFNSDISRVSTNELNTRQSRKLELQPKCKIDDVYVCMYPKHFMRSGETLPSLRL